jgi:type IV secretory pathway VirB4 component
MAFPTKQDLGNSLDLVDIKEIRDNIVIIKDGSLRQVVMVGGVNFALKSETEQNIITQAYQTFLNTVEFPLQVLIHSRKVNIDKYIENLLARKSVEESSILQNQIDEYAEFVKGFVAKNAIMEKTFLIVVPFFPMGTGIAGTSKGLFDGLPFFGSKKSDPVAKAKNKEEADRILNENVGQLVQRTSQVTTGILGIGLEATVLGNQELIELFYNFYNPQTVERGTNAGANAQAAQ